MRAMVRTNGHEWCQIEVSLTKRHDGKLSLSICGVAGGGSFKGGKRFKCVDGKMRRAHSFGQIREELTRFFPEFVQFFRWHLNDMHAECEHQEARGETWTTHPNAQCPDCGYKLGHAWTYRELPADVIQWARTMGEKA